MITPDCDPIRQQERKSAEIERREGREREREQEKSDDLATCGIPENVKVELMRMGMGRDYGVDDEHGDGLSQVLLAF